MMSHYHRVRSARYRIHLRRRVRRYLLALGVLLALPLLFGSCGPINIPVPIPTPKPTPTPIPTPVPTPPPPAECLPGVPWCGDMTPPQNCGACKHNPTADPAHCEMAPACPTQPAACPATCPAGQECLDPAVGCQPKPVTPPAACMAEADLVSVPCAGAEYRGVILDATTKLGRLGRDCAANLKVLAADLQAYTGKCAIGGIEALFIARSDGLIEENHACFFKDGTWTNSGRGRFMGCHAIGAPPPVPPLPTTPPSTPGCSGPVTPKVNRWNMVFRNRFWDVTPLFYNGAAVTWAGTPIVGYCNAVGFARQFCPARLDCEDGHDNFKCEERRVCEGYGIGNRANAVPLFRCEHGDPEVNPAQPFQARCAPGWIEVCATDGTSCSREVMP